MAFKEHVSMIAVGLILVKLLIVGLSLPDALGSLFILGSIHGKHALDYLMPGRPDLFKEVEQIKADLERVDTLQRDVTALKLQQVRR